MPSIKPLGKVEKIYKWKKLNNLEASCVPNRALKLSTVARGLMEPDRPPEQTKTNQTYNFDLENIPTVLSRIRIGHTRVTHSYLFERTTPPLCSCGENLTVKHLLECVHHAPVRSTLSSKPSLLDEPEGVKAMLEYLKLIGFYTKI
ncbi:hypothetical protein M8J77_000320 [Diaphorina citri]|nr:hypothetical protein M8J77_000320 [Diaphorina citri]